MPHNGFVPYTEIVYTDDGESHWPAKRAGWPVPTVCGKVARKSTINDTHPPTCGTCNDHKRQTTDEIVELLNSNPWGEKS